MNDQTLKSWPYQEARKLVNRFTSKPAGPVRFQTGFGPSGLPHIGTFAEVARTTWVRRALEFLQGWSTQLVAFSDDMDGLRKVPLNLPNRDMLEKNLGKPLCNVPDPFGCCSSYSDHMNNKLKEFLGAYGFDYDFKSAQDAYNNGDFDEGLLLLLENVERVRDIILPTIGEEKREQWSPFFPICSECGRIYSTRVTAYNPKDGSINYICENTDKLPGCGNEETAPVTGGRVKVGWKVDWALRWYAYDIAYEMYGKDLIESAKLSARIVKLMGKKPPEGFFYELFLDEEGHKISKSVGRGITVDAWVQYAPLESLLHFLFLNPRKARRIYWQVIPKSVDDYLENLKNYNQLETAERQDSPVWHIFADEKDIPEYNVSINFSMINNLIQGLGTVNKEVIIGYLEKYDPAAQGSREIIDDLVEKAVNYYKDFVLPHKKKVSPSPDEIEILQELRERVAAYDGDLEEEMQSIPFQVARSRDISPKKVFQTFYEVVMGQEKGPRFGSFMSLLGKEKMLELLDNALF